MRHWLLRQFNFQTQSMSWQIRKSPGHKRRCNLKPSWKLYTPNHPNILLAPNLNSSLIQPYLMVTETSWKGSYWNCEPRWWWTLTDTHDHKINSGTQSPVLLAKSKIRSSCTALGTQSTSLTLLPLKSLCRMPLMILIDRALPKPLSKPYDNAIKSLVFILLSSIITLDTLSGMN